MSGYILAVDDDADVVGLVEIILDQAGYTVCTAHDGGQALAKIAESRPDLVVLDLMMPEMSGFSVLRNLRSRPETSTIPVLILTARSTQTDTADAFSLGADVFLAKPFEPEVLIEFVNRLLATAGGGEPDTDEYTTAGDRADAKGRNGVVAHTAT